MLNSGEKGKIDTHETPDTVPEIADSPSFHKDFFVSRPAGLPEPSSEPVASSPDMLKGSDRPETEKAEKPLIKKAEEKPVILSDRRKKDMLTVEACTAVMPAAVVSYGCVLPGAENSEQFWSNVKKGIGGIVDIAEIYPDMKPDFMSSGDSGKIISACLPKVRSFWRWQRLRA